MTIVRLIFFSTFEGPREARELPGGVPYLNQASLYHLAGYSRGAAAAGAPAPALLHTLYPCYSPELLNAAAASGLLGNDLCARFLLTAALNGHVLGCHLLTSLLSNLSDTPRLRHYPPAAAELCLLSRVKA